MRELSGDFNTSRVKENAPPLVFTRKLLSVSVLCLSGEGKKRKTADARLRVRVGRHIAHKRGGECGASAVTEKDQ